MLSRAIQGIRKKNGGEQIQFVFHKWLCGVRECSMISMNMSQKKRASVGSSVLRGKTKESVCFLTEFRQAFEWQELAHDSCGCKIGLGVLVYLWFGHRRTCYACSCGAFLSPVLSIVEPVTLRVHRVRLGHSNGVRGGRFNVSQLRLTDRRGVSR